jgi:putative ABC transport system ATP-binding protein
VEALTDIDLDVSPGDHVAIVGPSGAGKSTLLNVLGLLERPSEGRYTLGGVDVGGLTEGGRAHLRARRLGFVFQSFHLIPHRTVVDNVQLALAYAGVPRRLRTPRALAALDQVGMGHRGQFRPSTLSGGESQRVAIARAIAKEPDVLLCDEPTGNLDSTSTAGVLALFDELAGRGLTIVTVTHDPAVSRRAERVVRVVDGRIDPTVADA